MCPTKAIAWDQHDVRRQVETRIVSLDIDLDIEHNDIDIDLIISQT